MKTFLSVLGIAALFVGIVIAEPAPADSFFPYVKGRYWLYDGTVRFVRDHEVVEKKITGWRSEVLDVVEGKDFKAALLKGRPGDPAWYEEGRERSLSIVILGSDGSFHDISDDAETLRKFAEIKSTGKLPRGLVNSGNLFFKTPVKLADRFGDPEQTNPGPRYCWVVENTATEKPESGIRGIPADKEFTTLVLRYRSSPDHTIVKFAAGLGVVRFQYVHHGTPGDCEMRLVETGGRMPAP